MHDKSLFQVIFELTCEGFKVEFYSIPHRDNEITMQICKCSIMETYHICCRTHRDLRDLKFGISEEQYIKRILIDMANSIKARLGEEFY